MNALVVYESLWGNTRAIAEAIAEGIGAGALCLGTHEADPEEVLDASLVVVGAPVHAFNLPSEATKKSVAARPVAAGALAPLLSQPPVREWLCHMPLSTAYGAAFDTRVRGPLGRGGASRIEKALEAKGLRIAAPHEGFLVSNERQPTGAASMLREGEISRARLWGAHLKRLASE